MRLLILGGTRFVGRHLVEAALASEHDVTVFNRGLSNPGLWPNVAELVGDRDGGLDSLAGRTWDAVIDTCGYVPRLVADSVRLLANATGHYTFVSSISAYEEATGAGIDESSALARLADPSTEEVTDETYGGLKVACERVVQQAMPGRALVVRPGLIVGPHDPTDRFTYWPYRVARGGEVLAPGRPERAVQVIDARDLASWMIGLVERDVTGVYNATGPERPLAMGELLEICRRVSGSDARFVWIEDELLLNAGVRPWTDLPLWIPESDPEAGLDAVDSTRAIRAGLRFRSMEDTVRDTLRTNLPPPSTGLRAGLDASRERQLLDQLAHG